MKPDVLLICPLIRHVMEALDETYAVRRLYEAADPGALLAAVGPRIRGVATSGHAGCSAAVMDALPSLEIIAGYGVGVDAVDLAHAARRGVVVTNTPDVLDDEVANLAVALVLATSRDLVAADRFVRDGRWQAGDMPLARGIRGRPVGILGLGRIGRDIARKLEVFGCDIRYHGRRAQPDQRYRYYADLVQMAADSDFLIVICPGGAETRHLVGRAVLDALGPEGTLINIARGSVVDEAALVAALVDGRLGAAGLDVFEDEPNVPEALLGLENVVLQPHRGSATVETRTAMGNLMLENLAAHFAGRPVPTPVAP
jgi:hydroxypyruvate reductase